MNTLALIRHGFVGLLCLWNMSHTFCLLMPAGLTCSRTCGAWHYLFRLGVIIETWCTWQECESKMNQRPTC